MKGIRRIGTFSKGILKRRLLPAALEAHLVAYRQSNAGEKLSGIERIENIQANEEEQE